MWEELMEPLRTEMLLVYFMVIFPVSLALVPDKLVLNEFNIYRLNQYDIAGNAHGSRLSRVNFEAATLGTSNTLRKCLVVWWRDLVSVDLNQLLQPTLGCLLIVIPEDVREESEDIVQTWFDLEDSLLSGSWPVPVHFAHSSQQLIRMIESLRWSQSLQKQSALAAIVDSVTANVFQLVSSKQSTAVKPETTLYNVVGTLKGSSGVTSPTLVIVAHYDAGGAAPGLSFGADSNGSGVAALLELARIFSHLYASATTRAKYNLVFLVSGGGKLSYQGARQWMEEQNDPSGESPKVELALCLESLGGGATLNAHISKQPKAGSTSHMFMQRLTAAAAARFGSARPIVTQVKKINLGEELLSWEHERFNIGRIAGLTLSRYDSPKNTSRHTIWDEQKYVDYDSLTSNVEVIGEALVRHIYNLPDQSGAPEPVLLNELAVRPDLLKLHSQMISSHARGSGLFSNGMNNPLLHTIHRHLHMHTDAAAVTAVHADAKDPEFLVFGEMQDVVQVYVVKPAVFDLLLAVAIAGYLTIVYYVVLNIHSIRAMLQSQCSAVLKCKSF